MKKRSQNGSDVQDEQSPPIKPAFFKVIVRETLESKKLMVPNKFGMEHGDLFSNVVTFLLPNGQSWKVGLTKSATEICFDKNWNELVELCSIEERNFLVFRFQSMSTFELFILDRSGSEIQYPSNLPLVEEVAEMEEGQKMKKKKKVCCESGRKFTNITAPVKQETESGTVGAPKAISAVHSARKFKSENPFFNICIKESNLSYTCVYIPELFTKTHMENVSEYVKLVVDDQREWSLRINRRRNGRLNLGSGWTAFKKETGLNSGDVCIFELVEKDVFRVSIFRD